MIDARNDFGVNANLLLSVDLVSDYANQQFFNALFSDISSLPVYRDRLISLNPDNISSLFSFYGH